MFSTKVRASVRSGRSQSRILPLAILFSAFSFVSLSAGPRDFLHRVWQVEDGLLSPVTRAIMQSSDGYLWLATDEGLVRFDGERFLEIEQRRPPEMHDRWIVALAEGSNGDVWTSSVNGGITRIFPDGRVDRYRAGDVLPHDQVMAIHEDREGTVWIGSVGGLTRYRHGEFITYDWRYRGWLHQAVRAIVEDSEGYLWIGTPVGLNRMRDDVFVAYDVEAGLANQSIMSLLVDADDNVWVGTSDGLSVYRRAEERFESFSLDDGLVHGVVRSLGEDSEGIIWIGTHGGLQYLHNGTFSDVTFQEGLSPDFTGAIPDFVYSIFEDREENMWIGTNLGLNRLGPRKLRTYSKEEGLPHTLTTSVYEDRDGALWIGTWGGGLARLRDGIVESWSTGDGLSSDFILGIHEDSAGNLWIGTDGGGLNQFVNGGFKSFIVPAEPPSTDRRAPNTIRLIHEDRGGNLLVGTNRGLYRFVDGEFHNFGIEMGVNLQLIKTIVEDDEGILWIGSTEGLIRVKDGRATLFGREAGVSGTPVNAIALDSDGLWISTDAGGLDRFENGAVTRHLSGPRGLLRERILHIIDDGRGHFWMSTRNGVYRVARRELQEHAAGATDLLRPIAYGRADGMRRAQCNGIAQPSGWLSRNGEVWFPTMNGVVIFDAPRTSINKVPPPVVIEEVRVDGEPVALNALDGLRPGGANLEFQFTALSFQVPEKVKFRYTLEGFDTEWQDGGTNRGATYNNIRPGEYRFRVIAANNDGVWNETGVFLDLRLPQVFYQTAWFYTLCGVGVLFSGAGIYRYRARRVRLREQALTNLIDERTRKLQQQIIDREQAEKRTAVLSKLGQSLSLASTFEEAAEVILMVADELVGWDSGYLSTCGPDEGALLPVLGYDIIEGHRKALIPNVDNVQPSAAAQRALESGGYRVLRKEPLESGLDFSSFGDKDRPSASLLYVPIRKGAQAVGLLAIQSYRLGAYSEEDLGTLQSLADYCAGALERIRAEIALHESQQIVLRQERLAVVGQLSAGVAHEFNNLLTIIQGHTSLALEDPELGEETIDMLQEVSKGAERAADLTRQLLAFSRRQSMHPEIINLNDTINKLAGVLGRLLGDNIALRCDLETNLPMLRADSGMMEQIIVNLAVNARDAMPHGGTLNVGTSAREITKAGEDPEARPGKYICMDISDTGTGMDRETVRRIFEPFFSTKEVGKGTGLGLASVYGIIKQHEGWIDVSSEPGGGTTFSIFLPIAETTERIGGDRGDRKVAKGGGERILVVEDEAAVRSLIRAVLVRHGYRVIEAADGPEALDLWERHGEEIDLLLTDMVMPGGLSGGELAAELLKRSPDLAVVYTSGYSREVAGGGNALPDDIVFLPKPHSPDKLTRAIRQALKVRGQAPEKAVESRADGVE